MPSTQDPLISVIVAVYNGAATLQQCMDSVLAQTHPSVELIVVDGGSRDGTVALIQQQADRLAYWVSEPDKGIYNAWNKALRQAKGDWICFLGADDYLWSPDALARIAPTLAAAPAEVNIVYGEVMLLSAAGQPIYATGEPWTQISRRFRQVMCISHQGVMHRRRLFEQHGGFDESFRIAGDYELMLRALKRAPAVFVPGVILAGMRQGGVSSLPRNNLATMREIRRAQRQHGQRLPGLTWLMAMARIRVRHALWTLLGEARAKRLVDAYRRLRGQPPYWTRT